MLTMAVRAISFNSFGMSKKLGKTRVQQPFLQYPPPPRRPLRFLYVPSNTDRVGGGFLPLTTSSTLA